MIKPRTIEGSLQRVAQRVSASSSRDREVVEVTCLPIDETLRQQTAGSGESEPPGLRQPADHLCDTLLKRRQQDNETPRLRFSQSARA